MTTSPDARLAAFARGHHGVFSRTVARRVGFSEKQIRHRLSTGHHPGPRRPRGVRSRVRGG